MSRATIIQPAEEASDADPGARERRVWPPSRWRLPSPRRTVRLRLTLLYVGLFIGSGALLLGITYGLVAASPTGTISMGSASGAASGRSLPQPQGGVGALPFLPGPSSGSAGGGLSISEQARRQELSELPALSAIALAIMALVSAGLGWLISGRVLAPLRTMTAATRRISAENLHRRLAMDGPSDELKDLGDTVDALLARLEASFEAERRFVANASHELRTPLTMMRTSLDVALAKPGPAPPQLVALSAKLHEGLERAELLIESLLVLARVQRGVVPDSVSVSLAELVAPALATRADAIAGLGLDLHRAGTEGRVTGNRTLLARMVENLVDNAVRHNVPGGWLRVQIDDGGTVVRLLVENGGPLLDQADVDQLAQPFRRIGAERVGGHGLGLSIVAAIAGAHGGSLQLEARYEGGFRAEVELPVDHGTEP